VDPNRIFWQRNEVANSHSNRDTIFEEIGLGMDSPRPPSYISEDGVSYVIEAEPRSFAPATDVPLPSRSERRRA
jgi:hypothetical protein